MPPIEATKRSRDRQELSPSLKLSEDPSPLRDLQARIHRLCETYRVVMCQALFFELLTAERIKQRTDCFRKFPTRQDPVVLVGNVGYFLRHEGSTGRPSAPCEQLPGVTSFEFSLGLADGSFQLTEEQRAGVRQWEVDQEEAAQEFRERYACTHKWFPQLETYSPGQDLEPIRQAQWTVANDPRFIASVFEAIRRPEYPPTSSIGPAWAFYRWLQVQLLYVLEYIRRYGANRAAEVGMEVDNDVVDAQYVTIALLTDALATKDNLMAQMYQTLEPERELIQS